MKQTHGCTGIKVTEDRVRVSIARRTPVPAKIRAQHALSLQFDAPRRITRIAEHDAGKWMEWEHEAVSGT